MALARGRLILGINCAYHESAAALVRDGEVVFADRGRTIHPNQAREDGPRLEPRRASLECHPSLPRMPFPSATLSDLDAIAYSLVPGRRLALIGGDPYEIDDDDGIRHADRAKRNSTGACWAFRTCWPARPVMNRSPSGFTSCPIIAPTPRAHSMRRRFRRAAVLVVDGIGEDVDRLARPRLAATVSSRSRKFRIRTRSACSGSGWPSISASRNSTPARSWAWPLTETIDASTRNLIGSFRFWIRTEDRSGRTGRRFASTRRWHGCAASDVRGLESLFGPQADAG